MSDDDGISSYLAALAHAEYGPLLVDTIYYPGSRQLTAVLVGNERVVYTSAGRRIAPESHPRRAAVHEGAGAALFVSMVSVPALILVYGLSVLLGAPDTSGGLIVLMVIAVLQAVLYVVHRLTRPEEPAPVLHVDDQGGGLRE